MNSANPLIFCQGLTKNYHSYKKEPGFIGSFKSFIHRQKILKTALKGLDLKVNSGEVVGLLGANGAGKTTLMKILSGIIVPSDGSVTVFSETPHKRRNNFKKRIALAMGQKNQLPWDLPAHDSFQLIKEYYSIDPKDFRERLNELTELLDVKHILNIQVRRLSLGERMKVEIMACLLHQPQLILLDEPTIGLDVNAQERLRQFFRDYHQRYQPTILLTSHYMVDIVSLCPRVVLLANGEKLYDGSRNKLTAVLGQKKRLHLIFQKENTITKDHPLITSHSPHWINSHELTIDIERETFLQTTAEILNKLPIQDFSTEEVPFEAVMGHILDNPDILKQS